jgi:hypothetical protein
MSLYGYGLA